MAHQRNVYPTDRIAHLWAQQTQTEARNPQHNLYFDGTVLYSYRDSYPIGNLITVGKGKSQQTVVLLQEDHYSHTTAQHCGLANCATTHMQQFRVPYVVPRWGNVDVDHAGNLKWYAEQVKAKVTAASKARQSAMWKYRQAYTQWEESVIYAKLFRQPKPVSPVKDWQAFRDECSKREQRAVALANDPTLTLDPKRYTALMKREAAKQAKRDAWMKFFARPAVTKSAN